MFAVFILCGVWTYHRFYLMPIASMVVLVRELVRQLLTLVIIWKYSTSFVFKVCNGMWHRICVKVM